MKSAILHFALLLGISVMPVGAGACSEVSCLDHGIELRPNFSVKVTHDAKPVAKAKVEITDRTIVFSASTSGDGMVSVSLPAGDYWLNVTVAGATVTLQCFHISMSPTRKARRSLRLTWADAAPELQAVTGVFVDSQPGAGQYPVLNILRRIEVPVAGAVLTLENPFSCEVLETTTDTEGRFAFGTLPPGTYVLHVAVTPGKVLFNRDYAVSVRGTAPHGSALKLKQQPGTGGSCAGIAISIQDTSRPT